MKLQNEFQSIRDWASERKIYEKGNVKTQFLKLIEETGELSKAILKKDENEIIDAIGDIVIVLTNLTKLVDNEILNKNINIEDCINISYETIKNRKGKIINETFVKNEI